MKTRPYNRLIRGLCIAGVLLLALGRSGSADERTAREYQVKAAFLFHFAQFTEWPADAFSRGNAPLVIAVVGHDDPFSGALERAVRDKVIGGHPIAVAHYDSVASLGPCHVLFVCDDEADALDQVLQKAGSATLTVGDLEAFPDHGGLVRFFPEDNKIRFEINLDAVRRSRIKISAKLLKLAKIVHE
jgi:hypothetical protein